MAIDGFWSADKVIALAPDPSAAKSAREIANRAKWGSLGYNGSVVWGEAKGSGSSPYQTAVHEDGPAFKCSCPSRKIPCKHTLGLLLMLCERQVTAAEPPSWVEEWLTKRESTAKAKATRKESTEVDVKGREKRAAKRQGRVAAGLADCELWLKDGIRQGLAWLQTQPPRYWRDFSARMVDAQAPGVARLIREMGEVVVSGDGWQGRLLEKMSLLNLLIQAYSRVDALPEATQQDIRTLIGWTTNREDLPVETAVEDIWSVLGQRTYPDDRLKVQVSWLQGHRSGRFALILSYSVAGQTFDFLEAAGRAFEGSLLFYPGANPLRAAVVTQEPAWFKATFPSDIEALTASYTQAISANPWTEQIPVALGPVRIARNGEEWLVVDAKDQILLIRKTFTANWPLLAMTGGKECGVFGEWDGHTLLPLGVASQGRYHPL